MSNNQLEAMNGTLRLAADLSHVDEDAVFACLTQVIGTEPSSLWIGLKNHITNKATEQLRAEINTIMSDVNHNWCIKLDTEMGFDDDGQYHRYAETPQLNDDTFPIDLSGDANDWTDYEDDWLTQYPSLTYITLEKLVYKLELLFSLMPLGFVLHENSVRSI